MKKLLILAAIVLTAAAAVSAQKTDKSMETALMTMEKQAWEAFGKGDGKFFESFVTDDFQIVGETGFMGKTQMVKEISTKPCDVKSFEFTNFKATMLDKNTALVTYEATQNGMCGGQAMPAKVLASSVFVKRGDKWLGAFHQETPVMTAPK